VADDAWNYWNAMAGFAPPSTPRVPGLLRVCATDLSGSDSTYKDRCPAPWVEINAGPDASTAQLVFSKLYFTWSQQYVREAVTHKPNSFASTKAKVLWLLDVATVMTLGMVATNIPLHNRHPFFDAWDSVRADFSGVLELMRTNLLSRYTAYPKDHASISSALFAPAPFMTFPLEWIDGYIRSPQAADLVYKRIYGSLSLQGGWDQFKNFLPKFYNEWQAATAAGDEPLARAMMQWWLWCTRDGLQTVTSRPILNPLNLGAWNDTPELSWYISTIETYESQSPELVRRTDSFGDVLYPNFATSYSSFERLTAPFLSLRFDKVVQAHLTRWFQMSVPRVDAQNRPLLNAQGYPLQSPVTYTDAALFLKQDRAAVAAQAAAAIQHPGAAFCSQMGWSGSNIQLPQIPGQIAYVASVAGEPGALSVAAAIPQSVHIPSCGEIVEQGSNAAKAALGPWSGMVDWIGIALLKKFGAALGVGWQLPIIAQPFVRTFVTPGFRTIPDGSTVDVFPRIVTAVQSLSVLLGVQLCAECQPLPAGTAQASTIVSAGPAVVVDTSAMQAAIVAASRAGFQRIADDPAYRRVVAQSSRRGRFVYNLVHAGEPFGPPRLPVPTLEEQRAQARSIPNTFIAHFVRGFTRVGNPTRS
jgi:hypothetical protein